MSLSLHQITKTFEENFTINSISFSIAPNTICALLGPSGCGKSTLLSIIAGLIQPDKGEIRWNGALINHLLPHQRHFGLVFQDFALFPHLNVEDNIGFGLRMQGKPKSYINERVNHLLNLVELNGYAKRNILTLSGGEQQRVALARSLAPQPDLLMLDEPFSALDRGLRTQLLYKLRQILRSTKQTAIYVTHDQEEAFAIADHIILMQQGKIVQQGTPQDLYFHPNSAFTAQFLGFGNLIPANFSTEDQQLIIHTQLGTWKMPLDHNIRTRQNGLLLIRPDFINLGNNENYDISGILKETTFRGNQQEIFIEAQGIILQFILPAVLPLPSIGEKVFILFSEKSLQPIMM